MRLARLLLILSLLGAGSLFASASAPAQGVSSQAAAFEYCDEMCAELYGYYGCRQMDQGWGFGVDCLATPYTCSLQHEDTCVSYWNVLVTLSDPDGGAFALASPRCAGGSDGQRVIYDVYDINGPRDVAATEETLPDGRHG